MMTKWLMISVVLKVAPAGVNARVYYCTLCYVFGAGLPNRTDGSLDLNRTPAWRNRTPTERGADED